MPLFPDGQDPLDAEGTAQRAPMGPGAPDPFAPQPTAVDAIGAAFRQNNPIFSVLESVAAASPDQHRDPSYNPLTVLNGTPFEQDPSRFLDDPNESVTRARITQMQREQNDRETLAGSGMAGTVAGLGAGLLDPSFYIPFVGEAREASFAARAARMAALGGAQVGASEAALQASQETRSWQESAGNIATNTLLMGILGGALGHLSPAERTEAVDAMEAVRRASTPVNPLDPSSMSVQEHITPGASGFSQGVEARAAELHAAGAAATPFEAAEAAHIEALLEDIAHEVDGGAAQEGVRAAAERGGAGGEPDPQGFVGEPSSGWGSDGASGAGAPVTAGGVGGYNRTDVFPELTDAVRQIGGMPQVRRGQVFYPGGAIDARYGVAELGDLVTSHDADYAVNPAYPPELQPRDRASATARDQVANMAGNLAPERLGPSPEANAGAPIVGPDGVVESGNGRTLAIGQAYDMGRGDAYRQWLEGQGFDTTGLDKPILVGMRETPLDDAGRAAFAHAANGSASLRMSATEQALSDARLIDGSALDLHAGPDLATAANRDFARAVVAKLPQGERGGMLTRDGSLSAGGAARVRNALTARAYGDPAFLARALDHPDPNIKAIAGALGDAAGPWARMRDAATAGDILPGHDITRDLLQAVRAVMRARDEGRPAWEVLNQGDMFQSDTTQLAARMLFRDEAMRQPAGRGRVAEALTRYAEEAARNTTKGRLFADDVTVGDVLRNVVAKVMPGASDDFVLASVRKIEAGGGWLGDMMREMVSGQGEKAAPPKMEGALEAALREIVGGLAETAPRFTHGDVLFDDGDLSAAGKKYESVNYSKYGEYFHEPTRQLIDYRSEWRKTADGRINGVVRKMRFETEEGRMVPAASVLDPETLAAVKAGIADDMRDIMNDEVDTENEPDVSPSLRRTPEDLAAATDQAADDVKAMAKAASEGDVAARAGEGNRPQPSGKPSETSEKGDEGNQPDLTLRNPRTGTEVQAQDVAPLAEMLKRFDASRDLAAHPLARATRMVVGDRLAKTIGDMKVYTVGRAEMRALMDGRMKAAIAPGFEPAGFFDPRSGHIAVLDDAMRDPAEASRLLVHEGLHGAFMRTIDESPAARNVIDHLRTTAMDAHLARGGEAADHYGLTNAHEFVSEAFSNPEFQRLLASIPADDRLVQAFGLDKAPGNSLWDVFVAAVRKIMGLAPDQHTLLDATMRVGRLLDDMRTAQMKSAAEAGHIGGLPGRISDAVDGGAAQASIRDAARDGGQGERPEGAGEAGGAGGDGRPDGSAGGSGSAAAVAGDHAGDGGGADRVSAALRLVDPDARRAAAQEEARKYAAGELGPPGPLGAAVSDERDLTLKGFGGLEKVPGLGKLNALTAPNIRVYSGSSRQAKRALADLADTALRFTMHDRGIATSTEGSAESAVRVDKARFMTAAHEALERAWIDHRYGDTPPTRGQRARDALGDLRGQTPAGKLSYKDFKAAVHDAMTAGDQHSIPQVAQAARDIRSKIFDPVAQRAQQTLGPDGRPMLGEELSPPKGDASFVPRMWNHEAVVAKRFQLKNTITDWLSGEQATKAATKERIGDLQAQHEQLGGEIDKLEKRLSSLSDRQADTASRIKERGGERDATVARADTVEERQAKNRAALEELREFVGAIREHASSDDDREQIADFERQIATLEGQERDLRVRGQEAQIPRTRSGNRLDDLQERATRQSLTRDLLEAARQNATGGQARVRGKIEDEIRNWKGDASGEAIGALKARDEAERVRGLKQEAGIYQGADNRLTSADGPVDRAVKRILASDRDLSRGELADRADEIIDRIIGSPDGRIPYDAASGGPRIGYTGGPKNEVRGSLRSRDFAIPTALVKDFVHRDMEHVLSSYLRTILPDIELTRRFGDVDMTDTFQRIQEEYARMIGPETTEAQARDINARRDSDITDIAAVRDKLRGVYGWSPDPMARKVGAIVRDFHAATSLASLGTSVANRLNDIGAQAVMRYGISNVFNDAWRPFFKSMLGMSPLAGIAKQQAKEMGVGIDGLLGHLRHNLSDINDNYLPGNKFSRGLQWANDRSMLINLHGPWTDTMKAMAWVPAQAELGRLADRVAAGAANDKDLARLADMNIDQAMASRISRQLADHAITVDGVRLADAGKWTDNSARDAFERAMSREANINVITAGIGQKPNLLSKPLGGLIGQFKGFVAGAHESILLSNIQQRDGRTMQGALVAMAMGMLSYRLYTLLSGQEASPRPQDWIKEGLARSALTGWFNEANNTLAKFTAGKVDYNRLYGADRPLTRRTENSPMSELLGPTYSQLEGLTGIVTHTLSGHASAADVHAARHILPLQNLMGARIGFDDMEDGIDNALGFKPRDHSPHEWAPGPTPYPQ